MPHPLIRLGGRSDRIVLFQPANGFPPEAYRAALTPVAEAAAVLSLPPRALWEDAGPPPAAPGSWHSLADDLLEGMEAHGLRGVEAIGHSFGAVALLLAAIRDPTRFRALALLDPTLLPPADLALYAEDQARGQSSSRPLVRGALSRRDRFDAPDEAFAYWRPKPLFADWSDAALREYVKAALRPAPEGGWMLRWPGAWEAWYYESVTNVWAELDRLPPGLPILVVRGERSDSFGRAEAERLTADVPGARLRVLPGQGHLFPLAAPEATGRLLRDWLGARPTD